MMPVGEEMVCGKVEEERNDDTDGIGDDRGYTQAEMKRDLNKIGDRHAGNARHVEAQATRPPGATMPGKAAERDAVVRDEIGEDGDLSRDQVRQRIVEPWAYGQWNQ